MSNWTGNHHDFTADRLAQIPNLKGKRVETFNKVWRAQKKTNLPLIWVEAHPRRRWTARWDTWTANEWPVAIDTEHLFDRLAYHAVRTGVSRSKMGSHGGSEMGGIYGLATEDEARVIAAAVEAALHHDAAPLGRIVVALAELPDRDR